MISKLTSKEIKPFMTFGKMPIANGFLNKEEAETEENIIEDESAVSIVGELLNTEYQVES